MLENRDIEEVTELTPFERKMLILALEQKLLSCEYEQDAMMIRRNIEIFEEGIEWLYDDALGLAEGTVSPLRSKLVCDILDMFARLQFSIYKLDEDEKSTWTVEDRKSIEYRSKFQGFDLGEKEGDLLVFCRLLFKYGKYEVLLDDFNSTFGREGFSEASMIGLYRKMLDVFNVESEKAEERNEDGFLDEKEIARVCLIDGY